MHEHATDINTLRHQPLNNILKINTQVVYAFSFQDLCKFRDFETFKVQFEIVCAHSCDHINVNYFILCTFYTWIIMHSKHI